MFVIPNALDAASLPAPAPLSQRDIDLLIVAYKQPALGRLLHWRLSQPGKRILLLTKAVARPRFLELVNGAKVTLFVPNRAEGFYLPALEGMALRTLVVCPDCVGNRSFCLPGDNCLRPPYRIGAIVAAVRAKCGTSLSLGGRDEGHGFAKKANQDYQFWTSLMFCQETLLK